MAVKHIVIHECDLCGREEHPQHITKIAIGLEKYDTCRQCTADIKRRVSTIVASYKNP